MTSEQTRSDPLLYLCLMTMGEKAPERITFNASPLASDALAWLAEQTGENKTAVINKALRLYAELLRETADGTARLGVIRGKDVEVFRIF